MHVYYPGQFWLHKGIRAYLIHTCIRKITRSGSVLAAKGDPRATHALNANGPVSCSCIGRTKGCLFIMMHAVFRQDRCVMDLSPL